MFINFINKGALFLYINHKSSDFVSSYISYLCNCKCHFARIECSTIKGQQLLFNVRGWFEMNIIKIK